MTDGFQPYIAAVRIAFGRRVDFAQLVKVVKKNGTPVREAYTPADDIVRCDPVVYEGYIDPHLVSTAYIERQNGTLRHMSKRLCRLTYAFSKRLENLKAAMSLHFCAYNFIRKHQTLKMTPAMAHGITNRFWEISDLLPVW